MDLSNDAKNRRNDVEEPLWQINDLLEKLELSRTRIDAAMQVWPDTKRTLRPALDLHDEIVKDIETLKDKLSQLWKDGYDKHWK